MCNEEILKIPTAIQLREELRKELDEEQPLAVEHVNQVLRALLVDESFKKLKKTSVSFGIERFFGYKISPVAEVMLAKVLGESGYKAGVISNPQQTLIIQQVLLNEKNELNVIRGSRGL